jgi:hypothetical protein
VLELCIQKCLIPPGQKRASPLERRMEAEDQTETYTHPDGSKVKEKSVVTGGETGRYVDYSVKQTHHSKHGAHLGEVNHYYRTPVLHGGHTGQPQSAGSYRSFKDPSTGQWATKTYGPNQEQRATTEAQTHLENHHRHEFSWPEDA